MNTDTIKLQRLNNSIVIAFTGSIEALLANTDFVLNFVHIIIVALVASTAMRIACAIFMDWKAFLSKRLSIWSFRQNLVMFMSFHRINLYQRGY